MPADGGSEGEAMGEGKDASAGEDSQEETAAADGDGGKCAYALDREERCEWRGDLAPLPE